jgi:hypothetical protein
MFYYYQPKTWRKQPMKCIKCIKVAKSYELNEIRRVNDVEADEKVNNGYWKFIPKTEWKAQFKKPAPVTEETK